MKKVSIFSKDYDKIIRRRKKIRFAASVIIVLAMILGGVVYLNFDEIKHHIENKNKNNTENIAEDQKIKVTEDSKGDVDNTKHEKNEHKTNIESTEYEEKSAVLDNGVKIDYSVSKKTKFIEKLKEDKAYTYELSDDKNMAIVFFSKTSEIFSLSYNGIVKNLSYETFIDTNGKRVKRDEFLKKNPLFIWMESPKLYKDKIYYATKLPNLNNNNRYFLWVCDISTGKHNGIYDKSLRAQKIVMGSATDKGLIIEFDGQSKCFNEKGKEVK